MDLAQISHAETAYVVLHYVALSLLFTSMLMMVVIPFRKHSPDILPAQRRYHLITSISALLVGICLYVIADYVRPAGIQPRFVLPIEDSPS